MCEFVNKDRLRLNPVIKDNFKPQSQSITSSQSSIVIISGDIDNKQRGCSCFIQ